MSKPNVPSLQHLCRNWHHDPQVVSKRLIRLADNPPHFNYNLLFKLARDMLVFGHEYKDLLGAVNRISHKDTREIYKEILPLLWAHFDGENPDFFSDIEPRFYTVGRDLLVPFKPPFIYGSGGQLTFPWLSFWKSNPLRQEALSLFVTLVFEMLADDPDHDKARFVIVDFSAPARGEKRQVNVLPASEIPRVTEAQKREMLDAFASGFQTALQILASRPAKPPRGKKGDPPKPDPNQSDMFKNMKKR